MRRDEEVERAVQAFKRAVAASNEPKPPKASRQAVTSSEPGSNAEADEPTGRTPLRAPIPVRGSITEDTGREL
jgi:hypothetical protein